MSIETNKRGNRPIFEGLEPRLLLSSTFDLDGDAFIGAGDDVLFDPAWHAEGGYAFSDSLTQPADTPGWNHQADFDGDFRIGSGDYSWLSTNWGKFANDPSIVFPSDPHDSDESIAQADLQGAFIEYMWFSEQYGNMAIANDGDDYFRIDVSSHAPVVTIDCRYEYASGDIDIELLDSTGAQVASSAYTVDNELIEASLPTGGAYYVRVFSPNGATGQRYDLWWTGTPPTDHHEDDDNEFQAPAHGNFPEDTWYSEIYGVPGVQADTDTFMIDVPAGKRLVTVDCTFSDAAGNIDMFVMDNASQIVGYSSSGDDNEHIEFLFETPGTHFIQLIGDSTGTTYDLIWRAEDTPLQAVEDTAVIDEDSAGNFVDVLANDLGSGLVITFVSGGTTDGSFAYITPPADFSGFSYFSYQIEEAGGIRDWGQIAVTVNPSPDDPIATDDYQSLPEGSVDYVIDVLDNDSDPDGDSLTIDSVAILGAEPRGSVWIDGDYVYYTVLVAGTGVETLVYTVSDGTGRTDTATVEVDIFTGLTPPVALDDDGTAIESHTVNLINVMGNDYDPDIQAIHIVDIPVQGAHGTASFDGLMVNYAPEEGYRGPDSFQYTIEDTTGRQATATVNMVVLPPSDQHEDDDNLAQADMLGVAPHMVAPCYLVDEDYYMIEIIEGAADQVTTELWSGPDVDMQLLDAAGLLVSGSYTAGPSDDKFIDTTAVSPGKYYIRVFAPSGEYWGQGYVIQWDSFGDADPHESDNTFAGADALGPLLPNPDPLAGYYNDDDFYRFEVQPGSEYVLFKCFFQSPEGELILTLYDSVGSEISTHQGYQDFPNMTVFQDVLPAGTYYVGVSGTGGPTGQSYSIMWENGPGDDPHEEDDTIAQAAAQNWLWAGEQFSQALGQNAILADVDYIEINIKRGFEHIDIECTFDGAEGDVDMWLYDADGVAIAGATSWSGSTEVIDTVVTESGRYYVKVYNPGGATGQFYDLIWNEFEHDDDHETDDHMYQARRVGPTPEDVWLDGRARNCDYYQIDIPQGYLQTTVILEFLQSEGDLNLELRSKDWDLLASSKTASDNEFIGWLASSPGTYFARIIAADDAYTGQDYRLWWNASLSEDSHEEDDDWTQADTQWDLPQMQVFNGTLWDDDAFRLEVPLGQEHISITCLYDSELGNADLYLLDSTQNFVAAGTGSGDSDFIELTVPSAGTYYLMVYDEGVIYSGLSYALSWVTSEHDDDHESDDSLGQADLMPLLDENTWFQGRQLDSDYFKITVPFQQQYFQAECLFDPNEEPILLWLMDDTGHRVATGKLESGRTVLDTVFPAQTTRDYYLLAYTLDGAYGGYYYDLKWTASIDDFHEDDDDLIAGHFKGATPQDVEQAGIVWDHDVWRLDVQEGRETVLIDMTDDTGKLSFELFDATGHLLAEDGRDVRESAERRGIQVSVPSAGSYYLRVSQYSGVFGDDFETGETYRFTWTDAPGAEYDWTMMWYLAADNNLEAAMADDLNEYDHWPNSSVAYTYLWDGLDGDSGPASSGQTVRYGSETMLLEDLGELDMTDGQTLQDYLQWSIDNYPAHNYLLIIDDHGTNFTGTCTDETNGTGLLTTAELADAIAAVRQLDIVMFSTCHSQTMEVAYELRNVTDYVIGHESTNYSGSWDMQDTLGYVGPDRTPEDVVRHTVTSYYNEWKDAVYGGHQTLSAVDTAHMSELASNMNAFADTVIAEAGNEDMEILRRIRATAFAVYYGEGMDIGQFMERVAAWGPELNASIRSAADNVMYAYNSAIEICTYFNRAEPTGLTVYYPMSPWFNKTYKPEDLQFVADTNWDDFLRFQDDSHEENDTIGESFDKPVLEEHQVLAGRAWDDDYYKIDVPAGKQWLDITLEYYLPDGLLNLYLYDQWGTVLASNTLAGSTKNIEYTVPFGFSYYICVRSTGQPTRQPYGLSWIGSVSPGAPEPIDPPPSEKIGVELVVLLDESGIDTSPALPAGLTEVYNYTPFVVEAWAKNIDGSPNGITGGYFGVNYDAWATAVDTVQPGGVYTIFPDVDMSPGVVADLGGQAPLGDIGYGDDEWVRIGWIEFTAFNVGMVFLSPYLGSDSFARANEGAIGEFEIALPDFVTFDVIEGPPMVIVDLQADSDTGASDSDNVTNDNTPTFDVTVNYDGTVRIDYEDDDVWDEVRWVNEPGTYEFTPTGPLLDGHYAVLVEFEAFEAEAVSHSDPTTIGTLGPEATLAHPSGGEIMSINTINVHERYIDVTFIDPNGSGLDASTIGDTGQEFTLSGAAAAGVTINGSPLSIGGDSHRYFFTGDFVAGAVTVDFNAGSFADMAGNANAAQAESFTIESVQASVADRHVFYNNSAWDGNDPAAGLADDGAIAADKQVLLPGGPVSFANYSSYSRGINGIMVDVAGHPAGPVIGDFGFRVSDPAASGEWIDGPVPALSVRAGEGVGGSDRVTLIWPDGAIVDQWIEVTVKSDANGGGLGLVDDDVFYFGSSVGDCDGDGAVGAGDYDMLVGELGRRGDRLVSDLDGDRRVGLGDFAIMRKRFGSAVVAPSFPVGAVPVASDQSVISNQLTADGSGDGVAPRQVKAVRTLRTPNYGAASVSGAPSETSLSAVSGELGLEGFSEIPSALEVLRSSTDYWFTEVTRPGSPVANVAATGEYDLRPLSDDPADYDLGDDLLVDILAESAFVGLRL
jgi:hypothetical protein